MLDLECMSNFFFLFLVVSSNMAQLREQKEAIKRAEMARRRALAEKRPDSVPVVMPDVAPRPPINVVPVTSRPPGSAVSTSSESTPTPSPAPSTEPPSRSEGVPSKDNPPTDQVSEQEEDVVASAARKKVVNREAA